MLSMFVVQWHKKLCASPRKSCTLFIDPHHRNSSDLESSMYGQPVDQVTAVFELPDHFIHLQKQIGCNYISLRPFADLVGFFFT